MEPNLSEISAKLDTLIAAVARIEATREIVSLGRAQYTRKEFAAMAGISAGSLKHRYMWRRYGGKKVGGRIRFSAAAVKAIAEGK